MDLRVRLQHPLAVALGANLLILLGALALSLIPVWSLRPVGGESLGSGTPAEDWFFPAAWSPDGSMFATEGPGRFQVAAADGTIVVRNQAGRSPVWVDERTVLVVREVDQTTGWLVRVDSRDGGREMVGVPMTAGRLVADGRGHVALWTRFGDVATSILDPADGSVLARLDGYHAQVWTNDGGLILKQRPPGLGYSYPDAGTLSIWRPGQPPRSLATDLIQLEDLPVLAPSGDAITCFCISRSVTAEGQAPAVYRVPLDGSPATLLTPWAGGNPHAYPGVAWIDEDSIAVVDRYGVFRVSEGGNPQPMPESPPTQPTPVRRSGRVYHLDGAIIVVTHDSRLDLEAELSVIDDEGRLRFRRRLHAWNPPYLRIDPVHHRALVVTDPNNPGEPSHRLFILEFS